MNITEYIYLMNKPDAVNEKQTAVLEKIVQEFPYFQSARALYLKGLYNQNSFKYNYVLKVTAAHTADRSVLFDFITSESFTSIQNDLLDQKLSEIAAIPVKESEVVEAKLEIRENTVEQSILSSIKEAGQDEVVLESKANDFTEPIPSSNDWIAVTEKETEVEIPTTAIEIENSVEAPGIENEIKTENTAESTELPEIIPAELASEMLPETPVSESPEVDVTESEQAEMAAEEIPVPTPSEQNLDIGKPLAFSKEERHSFQEWLQLSKFKPIVREEIPVTTNNLETDAATVPIAEENFSENDLEKQKKNELIDRFIQASPKIPPVKHDAPLAPSVIVEPSNADNSYLMTETLARVYLEQKKYHKAIQAYEILILKYPEKSSFFADRILDIKNLQQNNT